MITVGAIQEIGERQNQWADWVNPDLKKILIERRFNAIRIAQDPVLQELERRKCARDSVYWINNWVWSYDPRLLDFGVSPIVPLQLFPKQEEYLRWRAERREKKQQGAILKCRDAGISVLNTADQLHSWLFSSGYQGIVASRKLDLVDRRGDPGSLFAKLRFMLEKLPKWMRPKKYDDFYLKLINHDNGSVIVGEGGDSIGRGNRGTVLDLDEFAFMEDQYGTESAVSQTAKVRFYTSTPNIPGDLFYQKCTNGKIPLFEFNYWDDPRKSDEWFQEQVDTLDPITVNREILHDFWAANENLLIPMQWIEAAIGFTGVAIGGYNRIAGLDVGTSAGRDDSVLTIMNEGTVEAIYKWNGLDSTEVAYQVVPICEEHGVRILNYDVNGVGNGCTTVFRQAKGLTAIPRFGANKPTDFFWQSENRSSQDKFLNIRAESWFHLANRFKATYETKMGIRELPENQCISIDPNLEHLGRLKIQLTGATIKYTAAGKVQVETPEGDSPDFADSLRLCNLGGLGIGVFQQTSNAYSRPTQNNINQKIHQALGKAGGRRR